MWRKEQPPLLSAPSVGPSLLLQVEEEGGGGEHKQLLRPPSSSLLRPSFPLLRSRPNGGRTGVKKREGEKGKPPVAFFRSSSVLLQVLYS